MKTVYLNGVDRPAPFADRYDPLTADELRTLTASIFSRGVLEPVHTFEHPTHGLALLDGINRVEIASSQGLEVPVSHLGAMTEEEAGRLLDDKHLGRRNLTPEQQQARRSARVERVAAKRAEGKSLQTIADEEGVSKTRVRQDLETATVQGCTVEPETVIGKDGKSRPATRKSAEPKPAPELPKGKAEAVGRLLAADPSQSDADVAAEAKCDPADVARLRAKLAAAGALPDPGTPVEVPLDDEDAAPAEHPADVFTARVNRLCTALDKFKAEVIALADSPFNRHVHTESVTHALGSARKALWQSRPTEPCAYCPPGVIPNPACKGCRGTGRMTAARVLKKGGR